MTWGKQKQMWENKKFKGFIASMDVIFFQCSTCLLSVWILETLQKRPTFMQIITGLDIANLNKYDKELKSELHKCDQLIITLQNSIYGNINHKKWQLDMLSNEEVQLVNIIFTIS